MVAETKENMTRMFDTMADGFRTAFDTGRRTQEAFLRAVGDFWQRPADGDRVAARGERVYREFVPLVGKNLETLAQTCDATMRSGLDVFKAACDVSVKPGETDVYETSRHVYDAAFGAIRSNFDAFGKAGAKTLETCSAFYDAILRDEPCTPRGAAMPGKGVKVGG